MTISPDIELDLKLLKTEFNLDEAEVSALGVLAILPVPIYELYKHSEFSYNTIAKVGNIDDLLARFVVNGFAQDHQKFPLILRSDLRDSILDGISDEQFLANVRYIINGLSEKSVRLEASFSVED